MSLALAIKKYPTPFYYYDMEWLDRTLQSLKKAADTYDYHVHYALKANANTPILKAIQGYGFGADCVSGNEVKKAIETGFGGKKVVFAGVGKSDDEINYALDQDIFCFNCESVQEIQVIDELAKKKGKIASIALRINPNVNANTHKYITTGLEENKFGINFWEFDEVLETLNGCDHIKLIGLHFHIGSQIKDLEPFKNLCLRVNEIQAYFIERKIKVDHINLGGGLGVDYENPDEEYIVDFEKFFALFDQFLELYSGQEVHFELGRAVVAHCANLVSKVLYVKKGIKTNFAILDAGMTELIRPALYQAYHKIDHLTPRENSSEYDYDVVGPICESSDCFGKKIKLPEVQRGDILAIRSSGAYGEVMASQYNLRNLARVVYSTDF